VKTRKIVFLAAALLFLGASSASEVLIYTGNVNWISKEAADAQAQITVDKLNAWGIPNYWYPNDTDKEAVATWVTSVRNDGEPDVLVLYGYFPETIYPAANASPDNSLAEIFIESEDGNAIMNLGDAMFYISTPGSNNGYAGLQNMMDNTAITQSAADTPMRVTAVGKGISSSLTDYWADRLFFPSQLAGEWVVEAALGANHDGTRVQPAILRDGPRGRLIYAYGSQNEDWNPKGAVTAEIISWLFGVDRGAAVAVGLRASRPIVAATGDSRPAVWAGETLTVTVDLLEATGSGTAAAADTTVDLATDSATGAFYAAVDGTAVTSVTIPAGASYVDVTYKDTATGTPTLTASSAGLTSGTRQVKVFERTFAPPGDAAFYTARANWTTTAVANAQAQIAVDKLSFVGVTSTVFAAIDDPVEFDEADLANWVIAHTDNGELDVLVIYGFVPPTIYPENNGLPDGSIAELFIEGTDGDAIINHADAFWYKNATDNGYNGLRYLIDIPGFVQAEAAAVTMTVTVAGAEISPSLSSFAGLRPFFVDMLIDDWLVEASLAQNTTGARADPVIIRDGDRGRVIPALQVNNDLLPKGAVAADIIAWLYGYDFEPTKVGLVGRTIGGVGQPLKYGAQIQGVTGSPAEVTVDTVVTLQKDSATGAFDTSANGNFDGSVTSVTIAAGTKTAEFFYKDTAPGTPTLTASSVGFAPATLQVDIVGRTFAPAGKVMIYTGATWWIEKGPADVEALICRDRLIGAGIDATVLDSTTQEADLATWMKDTATGNGLLDVLVVYGRLPDSIYPPGNTSPDGSIAELFIESADGDAIVNHGDWMFYKSSTDTTNNGTGGLQNMMDIPGIGMSADNTPVTVTAEGKAIAPSLHDFSTDRPFFVDQLTGNWYVEATLAQDATGTRVEPAIVRDRDRGRLIAALQTNLLDVNTPDDPKGAVAAEIIAWLMGEDLVPTRIGLSNDGGAAVALTRTPMKLTVELLDEAGVPTPAGGPVTVSLATSSMTGAFDTTRAGAFDGSVISATIPAGALSATVYYRDGAAGSVTLLASDAGTPALTGGELTVTVFRSASVWAGSAAIYTGNVNWIDKAAADVQAGICYDALTAAGIPTTLYATDADKDALATWVTENTDNEVLDVLVLYGYVPETIYPPGNTSPDDSIAELFIESTDGDAILNHADWMFYFSSVLNREDGLRNMMDNPDITLWGDNTPMFVTADGTEIAPTLENFVTDRALRIGQLADDWFVEAALAQDAFGKRAEPIIIRDGNRGRLIPVFQTATQDDPKGVVAAEIIEWLMENVPGGETEPTFRRGDADGSGKLDLTDAIATLQFLYMGYTAPTCKDAADTDDSGTLDLTDAIASLQFQFMGGTPPASPGPVNCGPDPTPGDQYTECTDSGC
jgi:hypothetical protein